MSLPTKAKVVIIGGGIHGLSTAWKLSETYKNPGDIVVLEKKDTAAGASGIACGVVRNNYFQPAMRELMAHSVSVWESDPKAFKYNPVGYLQISPEVMHEDVASIYKQQKAIGYESTFIEGERDCMNYMKGIFDDWQAQGITSILHEKKGGYAFNKDSIKALEKKSVNNGVNVIKGVKVTEDNINTGKLSFSGLPGEPVDAVVMRNNKRVKVSVTRGIVNPTWSKDQVLSLIHI